MIFSELCDIEVIDSCYWAKAVIRLWSLVFRQKSHNTDQ